MCAECYFEDRNHFLGLPEFSPTNQVTQDIRSAVTVWRQKTETVTVGATLPQKSLAKAPSCFLQLLLILGVAYLAYGSVPSPVCAVPFIKTTASGLGGGGSVTLFPHGLNSVSYALAMFL